MENDVSSYKVYVYMYKLRYSLPIILLNKMKLGGLIFAKLSHQKLSNSHGLSNCFVFVPDDPQYGLFMSIYGLFMRTVK